MSNHVAEICWERGEQDFLDGRYSRRHRLRFDGGLDIAGAASPAIVPPPLTDASALDPEEAFVAALASCHMLWFLAMAVERGFRVDHYVDSAVGTMARGADQRMAITEVMLRPRVRFSGTRVPSTTEHEALHHAAHERCFLANSVKTEVRCQPCIDDNPAPLSNQGKSL